MGCDRARGLDCACRRTRARWSPGERWYNSRTGISPECAMLWSTRSQIQGTERRRDGETERQRKPRIAIVPKAAMRARLLPCVSFKPSCWRRAAGRSCLVSSSVSACLHCGRYAPSIPVRIASPCTSSQAPHCQAIKRSLSSLGSPCLGPTHEMPGWRFTAHLPFYPRIPRAERGGGQSQPAVARIAAGVDKAKSRGAIALFG